MLFIQIGPGILPFFCPVRFFNRQHYFSANRSITGIQLHHNTVRTYAFPIVIIQPLFLNCYIDFPRIVRIRNCNLVSNNQIIDCVVQVKRTAFRYCCIFAVKFHHIVGNKRAIPFILFQIVPCMFPVVGFVQRYSIAFRHITFIQLNLHTFRTNAILIVIIFPDFFYFNACFLRNMRVRDDCLVPGCRICRCIVKSKLAAILHSRTGTIKFFHRINNQCSIIFIFVQIAPCIFPVVCLIQCDNHAFRRTVLIQLNIQIRRTYAVLVIVILPDLLNFIICFTRDVGIRDRHFVLVCRISGRVVFIQNPAFGDSYIIRVKFFYCVDNRDAAVAILRQIIPCVFPATCCVQRYSTTFCSIILIQLNLHGCRTYAILIVFVFPYFLNINFRCFRGMRVCDCEFITSCRISAGVVYIQRTVPCYFVSGTVEFFYSINNLDALIPVFGQIAPRLFPVIRRTQRDDGAFRHTIFIQSYTQVGETDAILVVVILPDFFNLNIPCFRHMGIRYGNLATGRCISDFVVCIQAFAIGNCNVITIEFHYRVFNFCSAISILWQIFPFIGPTIRLIQDYCCTLCYIIFIQLNFYARRAYIILVVIIVPDFFYFDSCFLRCMRVCNCRLIPGYCVLACVVCVQSTAVSHCRSGTIKFFYRICNQFSIFILIQAIPCLFPVIRCTQSHYFAKSSIIFIQLYFQFCRTYAILVFIIFPELFKFYSCFLRSMRVRDCCLIILRCIVDCIIIIQFSACVNRCIGAVKFFHCINNQCSVFLVFVQVVPCFFPVVACVQRHCCTFCHIILVQLNRHTRRTFTILVVVIIPGFLNFNTGLFRNMGVSNYDPAITCRIIDCVICIQFSVVFNCRIVFSKFFYLIDNQRPIILILVQIFPFIFPAVS